MKNTWKSFFRGESETPDGVNLRNFLLAEEAAGKCLYPRKSEYFKAFEATPWEQVQVVLLGQDPYPGAGQAHGLAFSVRPGVAIPRSLANIYKELKNDLGIDPPRHGCLFSWARQGVLLLNTVLTVEAGKPASHQGRGWERLTDKAIALLSERREGLVFVLWGAYAQKKGSLIDRRKHLVIESAHPSPLSARRGFFGSRPFSRINEYLVQRGMRPIDWSLPEQVTMEEDPSDPGFLE